MSTAEITLDRSRKVALTGVLAALTLAANYIVIVAPNIELGSSILFITGFVFGIEMAFSCVMIVAVIFGLFNPWGPSIFIMEIWFSQVVGWAFIALAGHIVGRRGTRSAVTSYTVWELGAVGGILTLFYDLITNLGWAWASGIPFWATLASGLPFLVVHVTSNIAIFGLVVIPLESAIRKHLGGLLWHSLESEEASAKNKKSVRLE